MAKANTEVQELRFRVLIENKRILKTVIDRILEGSITLTNRELLTLLLDLRKGVRELVAIRQILKVREKVVSRLSRIVRVVTDCVKEDKAKELNNEIEIKSEKVFLQRE